MDLRDPACFTHINVHYVFELVLLSGSVFERAATLCLYAVPKHQESSIFCYV